jgi:hypothetical protein
MANCGARARSSPAAPHRITSVQPIRHRYARDCARKRPVAAPGEVHNCICTGRSRASAASANLKRLQKHSAVVAQPPLVVRPALIPGAAQQAPDNSSTDAEWSTSRPASRAPTASSAGSNPPRQRVPCSTSRTRRAIVDATLACVIGVPCPIPEKNSPRSPIRKPRY